MLMARPPTVQNISMPHSKERFLAPGEQITLWVELELPEIVEPDIFQVSKGRVQPVSRRTLLCCRETYKSVAVHVWLWHQPVVAKAPAHCRQGASAYMWAWATTKSANDRLPQAVGELRTAYGRVAAKSSRPVLPKPRSFVSGLIR